MFDARDIADLRRAADLVNGVIDRHPSSDLRVMSALCSALQDLNVAARMDANPTTSRSTP